MNELIEKLAADAGLLNYVDNETPRRYYIDGHADLEEVERFARLIVRECAELAKHHVMNISTYGDAEFVDEQIREHFGVKE